MIRRPGTILVLLTGLNLLNYLDRLVLSAVLPKLRDELGISYFEGGLLAIVFLLGYFVTSPIFGALGDRFPRKGLIAVGVIVWSAATLASGMAKTLEQLVIARAVVGVGEASYATLAPTIIDDVTPANKKGSALAIFYAATPIGAALGFLVGGFVESRWGWRSALYVAGGPGMVLALVCLLMHEPARQPREDKPNIKRDIRALLARPLYRHGVLGYCAYTAAIGAFSFWAPEFIYRRYAVDLGTANFKFGTITVVAGGLATFVGGRLADRIRARAEKEGGTPEQIDENAVRGMLRLCSIGSAIGIPLSLACFLSPSSTVFFCVVFFAILFLFLNTSPINAVILRSVPNELRASAMALCIFGIHLLGDLWSPAFVGLLADSVSPQSIAAVPHDAPGLASALGLSGARIAKAMLFLPVAVAVSAWIWRPPRKRG